MHLLDQQSNVIFDLGSYTDAKFLGCFSSVCYSLFTINGTSTVYQLNSAQLTETTTGSQQSTFTQSKLTSSMSSKSNNPGTFSPTTTNKPSTGFSSFFPTSTNKGSTFNPSFINPTSTMKPLSTSNNQFIMSVSTMTTSTMTQMTTNPSAISVFLKINATIFAFHSAGYFIRDASNIACYYKSGASCGYDESSLYDVLIQSSDDGVYIYQVRQNGAIYSPRILHHGQSNIFIYPLANTTNSAVLRLLNPLLSIRNGQIDLYFTADGSLYNFHADPISNYLQGPCILDGFTNTSKLEIINADSMGLFVVGKVDHFIYLYSAHPQALIVQELHIFGSFPNLVDFQLQFSDQGAILSTFSHNSTNIYQSSFGDTRFTNRYDLTVNGDSLSNKTSFSAPLNDLLCNIGSNPIYPQLFENYYFEKVLKVEISSALICSNNIYTMQDKANYDFYFSSFNLIIENALKRGANNQEATYKIMIDDRLSERVSTMSFIPPQFTSPTSLDLFGLAKEITITGSDFGDKLIQSNIENHAVELKSTITGQKDYPGLILIRHQHDNILFKLTNSGSYSNSICNKMTFQFQIGTHHPSFDIPIQRPWLQPSFANQTNITSFMALSSVLYLEMAGGMDCPFDITWNCYLPASIIADVTIAVAVKDRNNLIIPYEFYIVQSKSDAMLQGVYVYSSSTDPDLALHDVKFSFLTGVLLQIVPYDFNILQHPMALGVAPSLNKVVGAFDFTNFHFKLTGFGFRYSDPLHILSNLTCVGCLTTISTYSDTLIYFSIFSTNLIYNLTINSIPMNLPLYLRFGHLLSNVLNIPLLNAPFIGINVDSNGIWSNPKINYDPFIMTITGSNLICDFKLNYQTADNVVNPPNIVLGTIKSAIFCNSTTMRIQLPNIAELEITFTDVQFIKSGMVVYTIALENGRTHLLKANVFDHSNINSVSFSPINKFVLCASDQIVHLGGTNLYPNSGLYPIELVDNGGQSFLVTTFNATSTSIDFNMFENDLVQQIINGKSNQIQLKPEYGITSLPNIATKNIFPTFPLALPNITNQKIVIINEKRYLTFDLLYSDPASTDLETYPMCRNATDVKPRWYDQVTIGFMILDNGFPHLLPVHRCNGTLHIAAVPNDYGIGISLTDLTYVYSVGSGGAVVMHKRNVASFGSIFGFPIHVPLDSSISSIVFETEFAIGDAFIIRINGQGLKNRNPDTFVQLSVTVNPFYSFSVASNATTLPNIDDLQLQVDWSGRDIILTFSNASTLINYYSSFDQSDIPVNAQIDTSWGYSSAFSTSLKTRNPKITSVATTAQNWQFKITGSNLPDSVSRMGSCNNQFQNSINAIENVVFIYKTPKGTIMSAPYASCDPNIGFVTFTEGYGIGFTAIGFNITINGVTLSVVNQTPVQFNFEFSPSVSSITVPQGGNKYIFESNWNITFTGMGGNTIIWGDTSKISQYGPINVTVSFGNDSYTLDAQRLSNWGVSNVNIPTYFNRFPSLNLSSFPQDSFNIHYLFNIGGIVYTKSLLVQYPQFASRNIISFNGGMSTGISAIFKGLHQNLLILDTKFKISNGSSLLYSDYSVYKYLGDGAHNFTVIFLNMPYLESISYLQMTQYSINYATSTNENLQFTRQLIDSYAFTTQMRLDNIAIPVDSDIFTPFTMTSQGVFPPVLIPIEQFKIRISTNPAFGYYVHALSSSDVWGQSLIQINTPIFLDLNFLGSYAQIYVAFEAYGLVTEYLIISPGFHVPTILGSTYNSDPATGKLTLSNAQYLAPQGYNDPDCSNITISLKTYSYTPILGGVCNPHTVVFDVSDINAAIHLIYPPYGAFMETPFFNSQINLQFIGEDLKFNVQDSGGIEAGNPKTSSNNFNLNYFESSKQLVIAGTNFPETMMAVYIYSVLDPNSVHYSTIVDHWDANLIVLKIPQHALSFRFTTYKLSGASFLNAININLVIPSAIFDVNINGLQFASDASINSTDQMIITVDNNGLSYYDSNLDDICGGPVNTTLITKIEVQVMTSSNNLLNLPGVVCFASQISVSLDGIASDSIRLVDMIIYSPLGVYTYSLSDFPFFIYFNHPVIKSITVDSFSILHSVPNVMISGFNFGMNSPFLDEPDMIQINASYSDFPISVPFGSITRTESLITFPLPLSPVFHLQINTTLTLFVNLTISNTTFTKSIAVGMPLLTDTIVRVLSNLTTTLPISTPYLCKNQIKFNVSNSVHLYKPIQVDGCLNTTSTITFPGYYGNNYIVTSLKITFNSVNPFGLESVEIPTHFTINYPAPSISTISPSISPIYNPPTQFQLAGSNFGQYVTDSNFNNDAKLSVYNDQNKLVYFFNDIAGIQFGVSTVIQQYAWSPSILVLQMPQLLQPNRFYNQSIFTNNTNLRFCIELSNATASSCTQFSYVMPSNIQSNFTIFNTTSNLISLQSNWYNSINNLLCSPVVSVKNNTNATATYNPFNFTIMATLTGDLITPILTPLTLCNGSFATAYIPLVIGDIQITNLKFTFNSYLANLAGLASITLNTNQLEHKQPLPIINNAQVFYKQQTTNLTVFSARPYPCIIGPFIITLSGLNFQSNAHAINTTNGTQIGFANNLYTDANSWNNNFINYTLPVNNNDICNFNFMNFSLQIGHFNLDLGHLNVSNWVFYDQYITSNISNIGTDKLRNATFDVSSVVNKTFVLQVANLGYSTSTICKNTIPYSPKNQQFMVNLQVDNNLNFPIAASSCVDNNEFIYFPVPTLYGSTITVISITQIQSIFKHTMPIYAFYKFNKMQVSNISYILPSNKLVTLSRFISKAPVFITGNRISFQGSGFGDQLFPSLNQRQIIFNCHNFNVTIDCQFASTACTWSNKQISITLPNLLQGTEIPFCEFKTFVKLGNLTTVTSNVQFGNRLPSIVVNSTSIYQGISYFQIQLSQLLSDLDLDAISVNITLLNNNFNKLIDPTMVKGLDWINSITQYDINKAAQINLLESKLAPSIMNETRTLRTNINEYIYLKIPALFQGTLYFLFEMFDGFFPNIQQYEFTILQLNNTPIINNCLPVQLSSNISLDCVSGDCQFNKFNIFQSLSINDPNRIYVDQPYALYLDILQFPKIGHLYSGNNLISNEPLRLGKEQFTQLNFNTNNQTINNSTDILGNMTFQVSYNNQAATCNIKLTLSCDATMVPNVFKRPRNGVYRLCENCPEGAICDGLGAVMPTALSGYKFDAQTGTFLLCTPQLACNNGQCDVGYSGERCGTCDKEYYRTGIKCEKCKNTGAAIIGIILGIIILIGGFIVYLLKKGVSLAAMTILINFCQYLYIMNNMELQWPPLLGNLLSTMGSLAFSLEITTPECLSNGNVNYYDKYTSVFLIPIIITSVFVLMPIWLSPYLKYPVFKVLGGLRWTINKVENTMPKVSRVSAAVETINKIDFRVSLKYTQHQMLDNFYLGLKLNFITMTMLYVNIASMGMSYFSCRKIAYGDKYRYYLVAAPDTQCYVYEWYNHLPIAIFSILFYIVGIPLVFCVLFVCKQQTKYKNEVFTILKTIAHKIYTGGHNNFKSGLDIFIPLQLIVKLCVISTSAFFANYIGIQAIAIQVCLTLYLVSVIHYRPYKDDHLNRVEIYCDIAAVIALSSGLLYYTSSSSFVRNSNDKSNNLTGDKLSGLTIIVFIVIIGAIIGAFMSTALQTHKLYKLRMKEKGETVQPIGVKVSEMKDKATSAAKSAVAKISKK